MVGSCELLERHHTTDLRVTNSPSGQVQGGGEGRRGWPTWCVCAKSQSSSSRSSAGSTTSWPGHGDCGGRVADAGRFGPQRRPPQTRSWGRRFATPIEPSTTAQQTASRRHCAVQSRTQHASCCVCSPAGSPRSAWNEPLGTGRETWLWCHAATPHRKTTKQKFDEQGANRSKPISYLLKKFHSYLL